MVAQKPISVVISSRLKEEESADFLSMLSKTSEWPIRVMYVINENGIALTKIYSSMLSDNRTDSDIMVFVHDDVEFLRPGWGKELVRLFNTNKKYGIIGVAGSAQFDENGAWWQYEKKYGQVLHKVDGKSWLTIFSPLLDKDLEEVCVIDGLFMAVNRRRIRKDFDTDIEGFDMYDIDFCLANYLSGKCKIGVTTNIRLAHKSAGDLKESWYKNREYIIKKYGDKFPIEVGKK